MLCHADLLAHVEDGAGGALGAYAGANVLAERHEALVDRDPVPTRQNILEDDHRPFGRPGRDVAPAVGNAVDMDVDADSLDAAGDSGGEVRALRPDTGERLHQVGIAGQLAAVVVAHDDSDVANLDGLALMVGDVLDGDVDFLGIHRSERVGRAGLGKEAAGGDEAGFVPGANREDTGDELLEG